MDIRPRVHLPQGLLTLAFCFFTVGAPGVRADEPATASDLDQLQKQKAQYEAQKAMYDAQAQMYAAELAAAKARYGDVEPKFKGEVSADAGAANAEAQLLSNQAVNKLALNFANALMSPRSRAWSSWRPAQPGAGQAASLQPGPKPAEAKVGEKPVVIGKCIVMPLGDAKPAAPAAPAAPAPLIPNAGAAAAAAATPGAGTPNGSATPGAAPPWTPTGGAPAGVPAPVMQGIPKRLVLTTTLPDFQAALAYDARTSGLRIQRGHLPPYPEGDKIKTANVAAASLALKGLDTLLSFFRTDFSFKSVSVTAAESEWTTALSGALADQGVEVLTPGYDPAAAGDDAASQIAELDKWLNDGAAASTGYDTQIKACGDEIDRATTALKTAKGKGKAALEDKLKLLAAAKLGYEADKARWTQFVTATATWVAELTTATSDGKIPVVETMKQRALQRRLCGFPSSLPSECGRLALTKLDHSVGNSYIKKNLWSGLGANPFYVMGGAVASLTVFGDKGEVLFAKTGAVHGQYLSVSDVPDVINGKEAAPARPGIPPSDS
jgi:hypothetical protein